MHRAARNPGDCTGSMLAGGRWNPIGTPMLYTAEHLSLACLEILVHLDKNLLPRDYVWSSTDSPETPAVAAISESQQHHILPKCWSRVGRTANDTAVRVPSAIIPEEFNILLNPKHPGFARIVWSQARPFRFDPGLFLVEPHLL